MMFSLLPRKCFALSYSFYIKLASNLSMSLVMADFSIHRVNEQLLGYGNVRVENLLVAELKTTAQQSGLSAITLTQAWEKGV